MHPREKELAKYCPGMLQPGFTWWQTEEGN